MQLYAKQISKKYNRAKGGAGYFYAVRQADITLTAGTVTALYGRSGSGKTTLLHMLGGILQPSQGAVYADETDLYRLEDKALSAFRNQTIGYIPQGTAALSSLTVLENVCVPALLGGRYDAEQASRAGELLRMVGMADLRDAMPGELSGGELRRMAIARALMNRPAVLLADEPTGDLDDENTALVLDLLRRQAQNGAAVLVATHDGAVRNYADIVLKMDGGVLSNTVQNSQPSF